MLRCCEDRKLSREQKCVPLGKDVALSYKTTIFHSRCLNRIPKRVCIDYSMVGGMLPDWLVLRELKKLKRLCDSNGIDRKSEGKCDDQDGFKSIEK